LKVKATSRAISPDAVVLNPKIISNEIQRHCVPEKREACLPQGDVLDDHFPDDSNPKSCRTIWVAIRMTGARLRLAS